MTKRLHLFILIHCLYNEVQISAALGRGRSLRVGRKKTAQTQHRSCRTDTTLAEVTLLVEFAGRGTIQWSHRHPLGSPGPPHHHSQSCAVWAHASKQCKQGAGVGAACTFLVPTPLHPSSCCIVTGEKNWPPAVAVLKRQMFPITAPVLAISLMFSLLHKAVPFPDCSCTSTGCYMCYM